MGRAKKVLDFASTLYFFHFLFCFIANGFPTSWIWWICMIVSILCVTLVGEYLCQMRELQDIKLSNTSIIGPVEEV